MGIDALRIEAGVSLRRMYLAGLLSEAGHSDDPEDSAAQLMLLLDGAIMKASVGADDGAAQRAKRMAERLLSVGPAPGGRPGRRERPDR